MIVPRYKCPLPGCEKLPSPERTPYCSAYCMLRHQEMMGASGPEGPACIREGCTVVTGFKGTYCSLECMHSDPINQMPVASTSPSPGPFSNITGTFTDMTITIEKIEYRSVGPVALKNGFPVALFLRKSDENFIWLPLGTEGI